MFWCCKRVPIAPPKKSVYFIKKAGILTAIAELKEKIVAEELAKKNWTS